MALGLAGVASAQQPGRACDLGRLAPGLNTGCTLQTGDGERVFDVTVPARLDRNAAVVIDFHGLGSNKDQQRAVSGLAALVERDGIVLIHPQGIDNSWNGMGCCPTASTAGIDDVGFAREAVEAVSRSLDVQPAVRATSGISNGMTMTNRLACEAADFFDLAAGVSFQLAAPGGAEGLRDRCPAGDGLIYEEFHATADTVVPFAGAAGGDQISLFLQTLRADAAPAALAQIRGCAAQPERSELNSNTTCQLFSGCDGGGTVGMCTVTPGNHVLYPTVGERGEPNFADRFSNLLREAEQLNRRGVLRAADRSE